MTDSHLESLYQEAKSALKARDYEYAIELLKRVLVVDENYKDTSRLLEKAVRLHKLRWYKNPRLWGVLGLVVVFVLGIVIAPRIGSLFASPAPTTTEVISPTATRTAIPTSSPTVTPTRTPRPTPTLTPLPSWVGSFAQPILDAIASRPPDFQDDFGIGSAGWKKDYCPGSMEYVDGELVFKNCRIYRPGIDWRDFAVEFDIRYLEGNTPSSYFSFQFRDLGNSGHSFRIDQNGEVLIGFANIEGMWLKGAHPANQWNHILLIAKENEFAFYLNGEPFYHAENDAYRFGRCVFYAENPSTNTQAILAMDNFKIWDLDKIP